MAVKEIPYGYCHCGLNHNKLDNRKCNLRPGTWSENQRNRLSRTRASSGHRNVSWNKQRNKWAVILSLNGHRHHGGFHSELHDAVAAAEKLRAKFGVFCGDQYVAA